MFKPVSIADLSVGMMVTKVIEQSGPVRIRKVGMIRSLDMVKGLKEMGVILLEVDTAQSIQMDEGSHTLEHKADHSSPHKRTTVTQRLVASDKQIADADRNLSQQFHRSLFLPAVDQMPSKWTLYAKPYALLLVTIAVGVSLGYLSSRVVVNNFATQALTDFAKLAPADNDKASEEPITSETATNDIEPEDRNLSQTENAGLASSPSENSEPNVETPTSAVNNETTIANESEQQTSENLSNKFDRGNTRLKKVEGIELEEGQQVLGYQANNEQEARPANDALASANENNTEPTQNDTITLPEDAASTPASRRQDATSAALYRKIQQAAQEVDRQSNETGSEVLSVTDLNDLPRIDQLPSAILTQMPAMSFSAHMFASNPKDRWVRVNSRRLGEGEYISDGLMIKNIEAEKVVLEFKNQVFTMNALSDW